MTSRRLVHRRRLVEEAQEGDKRFDLLVLFDFCVGFKRRKQHVLCSSDCNKSQILP
uniref:Uncharacterized protein n=1 Tax=Arundo donax TaxID=35708 RepID=A0A0A9HPF9_ARUDO